VYGLYVPNLLAIFANRAVRGKLAHPRYVQNGLAQPISLISPQGAHLVLTIYVGLVIREQEERVMPEKVVDKRAKKICVALAKCAGDNKVQDVTEHGVLLVIGARPVSFRPQLSDLLHSETKKEKVVVTDFLANFNVGAVECSDGASAV
jgi:hypothetical protein